MTTPATSPAAESNTVGQAPPEAPEPFGQTGIRQFIGPVIHWACLIGFAICIALWIRSTQLADGLVLRRGNQNISILSLDGYVRLNYAMYSANRFGNNSTWAYRSRPMNGPFREGWDDSLFKRIGIEFRTRPLDRGAASGFWIGVRWYFAAALCLIIPVTRGLLQWRRTRAGE